MRLGFRESRAPSRESGGKLQFQRPQENFTGTGLLKGDGQIGKWKRREEKHTAQDIGSDRGSSEVRTQGPQTHQNLQLTCLGIRSYRGVPRFF